MSLLATLLMIVLATPSSASEPSVRAVLTAPVGTPPEGAVRAQSGASHHVSGAPPTSAPRLAARTDADSSGAPSVPNDVRQGREGLVTHMGAGYPANYVAIPLGPGKRIEICGPRTCLTVTSTDAGPSRASLQAGRIADVSVQLFAKLCCDPSRGTFRGSWRLADRPTIQLPATDTLPEGETP